jgi:putative DNA primase/helicase
MPVLMTRRFQPGAARRPPHTQMNILPHHLADLRRSGLSDGTIATAGIYSETDHRKLAGILNRKTWSRKLGAGLVFPFHDEAGAIVLQRIKPDNPPVKNGKPAAKYLSPTDMAIRVYIPPSLNGELMDTGKVLLITEGEKKALAGIQAGISTIGLTGVDCWHKKKSSALLPDLERIEWNGRRVIVAFDSDGASNPNVRENESLLAAALTQRGASVKLVRFPTGLSGEKVGLDDYLVAHGASELWRLIEAAEEPEPPAAEEMRQPASAMLPEAEAADFLKATEHQGQPTFVFWRDSVYRYRRGAYREVSDTELRSAVTRWLNNRYTKVGAHGISDVLWQIKAQCVLPGDTEPPHWLSKAPGSEWPITEIIVTQNKIVHLPSLFAGTLATAPVTPALFARTALDFNFAEGDCPAPARWLKLMQEFWQDDPESVEALQLWFGYCLAADTSQQKLLLLVGPKRSGKGTVARVLRRLVGEKNVAAPTLSAFSTNFGLWPLADKSLAIIGDLRLSNRPDGAVIVERILSITGEDAITVDRKFLTPITCTFPTRLMLISNELPRLHDASGALVSRMIVLRLTRSWLGKEDRRLTTALLAEAPGILWWAIDGWRKLQKRGALFEPQSGIETFRAMEDLSSPVGAFLRDECQIGPEHSIPRADLYAAYQSWCERHGKKKVEDEAGFGRNLRASLPELWDSQPRVNGKPTRHYVGVALKSGF